MPFPWLGLLERSPDKWSSHWEHLCPSHIHPRFQSPSGEYCKSRGLRIRWQRDCSRIPKRIVRHFLRSFLSKSVWVVVLRLEFVSCITLSYVCNAVRFKSLNHLYRIIMMRLSADKRTILTNRNCIHEHIKSRLNPGNVRYHSVASFFSPFDI